MAKKTFHCEIHTPDGPADEGEYHSVNFPALDGYMGILAGRAPVTVVLTTGLITLQSADGAKKELFVSRGFLQARPEEVEILAEECKPIEKLDAEQAWDLLQEAYTLPRETPEQEALRDEAIQAGRIRFRLAQKGRKSSVDLDSIMTKGL
jgi:F-type H+-transporting ATPase subunit epsilon